MAMKNYAIGVLMSAVDRVSGPMRGIKASLGGLSTGLGSTSGMSDKFTAGLSSMAKGALAVGAAIGTAGAAVYKLTKDTIDFGDGVNDMAGTLGMSTKALQEYRYVATLTGLTTEEMDTALQKMTINLGKESGATEEAIKSLGLSIADIKAAAPDRRLELIADAMAKIKGPTERAALTTALFGKSSLKLTNTMASGAEGIRALRAEANELGYVMNDETVQAAANADDAMNRFNARMTGIRNNIGSQFIPVLLQSMGTLGEWANKNQGMMSAAIGSVGALVGSLVQVVAPVLGTVSEILSAVFPVVTEIVGALVPVISTVVGVISQVLTQLKPVFSLISTLLKPILQLVSKVVGVLGKILAPVIEFLGAVISGLADVIDSILSPVIDILTQAIDFLASNIGDVLTPVLEFLAPAFTAMASPIKTFMHLLKSVGMFVADLIRPILAFVRGAVYSFGKVIGYIRQAFSGVAGFFTGIWGAITAGVDGASKFIGTSFQTAADWVTGIWQGVGDWMDGLWTGILDTFNSAIGWITDKLQGVADFLSGIVDGVKSVLGMEVGSKATQTMGIPMSSGAPAMRDGMPGMNGRNGTQKQEVVVDFRNLPRGTKVQSQGAKQGLNMSMGYANVGF